MGMSMAMVRGLFSSHLLLHLLLFDLVEPEEGVLRGELPFQRIEEYLLLCWLRFAMLQRAVYTLEAFALGDFRST